MNLLELSIVKFEIPYTDLIYYMNVNKFFYINNLDIYDTCKLYTMQNKENKPYNCHIKHRICVLH